MAKYLKKSISTLLIAVITVCCLGEAAYAVSYVEGKVIFSDDFSTAVAIRGWDVNGEVFTGDNTPAAFGASWEITMPSGYNTVGTNFQIGDGVLKLLHKWGQSIRMARVELNDSICAGLPAEQDISLKMGTMKSDGSVNTATGINGSLSTIFVRFAVKDESNYYEVGYTGNDTALTNYPLGVSGTDYQSRLYFRKVAGGVQTYIDWEDYGDGGLMDMANDGSRSSAAQQYERYEAMYYSENGNKRCADVAVSFIGKTVTWSISGKGRFDESYQWQSSYTDSAAIGTASVNLQLGTAGHEHSAVFDDVIVKTVKKPDYTEEFQAYASQFNTAVTAKSSEQMLQVLAGLKTILDYADPAINLFNYTQISGLTDEKKSSLAGALLAYAEIDANAADHGINTLLGYITGELTAYELENISNVETIKQIVEKNNVYYNFPVTQPDFIQYQDEIYASLVNLIDIGSLTTLRAIVSAAYVKSKPNYVLKTFGAIINYREIIPLLETYSDTIGYNTFRYNKISDKYALAQSLMKSKASITTIGTLADAIDSYQEPKAGSSGGSGGSSRKGGSYAVTAPVVVAAEIKAADKPAEVSLFPDVATDYWAYDDIARLCARKIIQGYADGTFKPLSPITKAEFVKVLTAAFGISHSEGFVSGIQDNSKTEWYYPYLSAAEENGIIWGDEKNNFYPDKNVTREEIALFIYRVLSNKNISLQASSIRNFTDAGDISDEAYPAVMQLQSADIISGNPDGSFAPQNNATRAEASKIIGKALSLAAGSVSEQSAQKKE